MMFPTKFVEAKSTPKCPRHKECCLRPEGHPIAQEGTVYFWRCDLCPGKLYTPDVPGVPR